MPLAVIDSVARQLGDLRQQVEADVNEVASMVTEVERTAVLLRNSKVQYARLCALIDRADTLRRSAIAQQDALRKLRASIHDLRRSLR